MRTKEVCQYEVNASTGVKVSPPPGCINLDIIGDLNVILSISGKPDGYYHTFGTKTYHYSEKTDGAQPFYLKADGSGTATVLFITGI